ncbi:MAG: T9SS type B sorting domain-containing protein [bacterium]
MRLGYFIAIYLLSMTFVMAQDDTRCPFDAGMDGALAICSNDPSVDLFNFLLGTPDPGGVWTPTMASGTGFFNPEFDSSDVYFYTVGNDACGYDVSTVSVSILNGPDAGEDGLVTLCEDSASVSLFDALGGTPDIDGFWSPPLASGSDIFNPAVDTPGVYTYTVTSSICTDNTADVTVEFVTDLTVENYEIVVTDFSDNNMVEILIDNPEIYSYTLGNTTSTTPLFEFVLPGVYQLTITEIQGCAEVTVTVFVRGYQLFFTPNGDGFFDTWKIIGFGDQPFQVTIFDRYGKILATLDPENPDWDGTFNGQLMPSSDYWYRIATTNETFFGHFALKR